LVNRKHSSHFRRNARAHRGPRHRLKPYATTGFGHQGRNGAANGANTAEDTCGSFVTKIPVVLTKASPTTTPTDATPHEMAIADCGEITLAARQRIQRSY
jgi:hypothetical protein